MVYTFQGVDWAHLFFELTGSILSLWDNHCLNPQLDSFWSGEMLILQIHIIELILTIGISIHLLWCCADFSAVFSHFGSVFWQFGVSQMYRKSVQQLLQTLLRKLAAVTQYEEVLAKIDATTSTDRLTLLKTKPQSVQRDIITVCNDPYVLAQQLTHIELVSCYTPGDEFVPPLFLKCRLTGDMTWLLLCFV